MSAYSLAKKIIITLQQAGFIAYIAGGWVRDFLMDHPSDDIDIATSASAYDVQRLFPKTIPVGIQFGIIIVVEEGQQFEVATFRQDLEYKDGRRPAKIKIADPKEDAKRRDFTINGLFYDPIQKRIFDYIQGQQDINEGIIRAIGDPHKRFLEDRLRMIRAVRYASRFHFLIETETIKAIIDHAPSLFPAVAMERVWNELVKMAAFPNLHFALISLHQLNLLPIIFPTLSDLDVKELKKRTERLPYFPKKAPVIAHILELFPDASLEEKLSLCNYFKLPNKDRQFTSSYHQSLTILLGNSGSRFDAHSWAYLYSHSSFPLFLEIASLYIPFDQRHSFLQNHHIRMQKLASAIQRIQKKTPILSSDHLRAAGIKNGKKMGVLLKEGEKIAINAGLNNPEAIIVKLKELPIWNK